MMRQLGLMVVVLGSSFPAASPGADGPSGLGGIVGRVVDSRGRPVAGAEVWGVSLRKEVGRAVADAEGRFRLGPIAEDKPVDVWSEGEGLARERREGVRVFGGRDVDLGTLTLVPGTAIAGRVVDAQGRAVAGASVAVDIYRRVLGHTIGSDQTHWELAADADGRFRTQSLPPGEAAIEFASAGKVRTRLDRRTNPGVPGVDLGDVRLEDEVPIRGIVVDGEGKPAPKVEVTADYDDQNKAITGPDGRFTLGGTGREAKELRVESNDYFAPKPFPIGPNRDDVRLSVIKAYEIHGSAVDAETGAPVNLETVRLCMVVHEPDGTTSLQG